MQMIEKELAQLTDAELLDKRKKVKANHIFNAAFMGLLIGIAIYSTVKRGVGLFTFFPLFFAAVAAKNTKEYRAIQNEVKLRKMG